MGAGVADPERISKDVIFPNYNWPDLGKIKQQWNITTFVVLSQQMIKSIKVGKLALKTLLSVSFAALFWDVTNKWKNKTKQIIRIQGDYSVISFVLFFNLLRNCSKFWITFLIMIEMNCILRIVVALGSFKGHLSDFSMLEATWCCWW